MELQKDWYSKPSQRKQRAGKSSKTFRHKNYDVGYGDEQIDSLSKKQILSEKKRRFKQNIKNLIHSGNYDELEEYNE